MESRDDGRRDDEMMEVREDRMMEVTSLSMAVLQA